MKNIGFRRKALSFNVEVGSTFKIADIEFIRFPEVNGAVPIVTKECVFAETFDDTYNNFATSSLLKKLRREILPQIEAVVGADNVLEFETDLISLDGLKDYGKVKSKISLPTFDFYRENIEIFEQYTPKKWWWLATPWSAPTHSCNSAVCNVYGVGSVAAAVAATAAFVRFVS